MSDVRTRREPTRNISKLLCLSAIAFFSVSLGLDGTAWAGTGVTLCTGTVDGVHLYGRTGKWEGGVLVRFVMEGIGTKMWPLCNLNADEPYPQIDKVQEAPEDWRLLYGTNEISSTTCHAVLNELNVALATRATVKIAFLQSVAPTYPELEACDTIPSWGGVDLVPGEDDSNGDGTGRLGAWDAFYYLEVLKPQ